MPCQESRPVDKVTRIRQYACCKCNKVYQSLETLDESPEQMEVQKRILDQWNRDQKSS